MLRPFLEYCDPTEPHPTRVVIPSDPVSVRQRDLAFRYDLLLEILVVLAEIHGISVYFGDAEFPGPNRILFNSDVYANRC